MRIVMNVIEVLFYIPHQVNKTIMILLILNSKKALIFLGLLLFAGLYLQMRPITAHESECTKGSTSIRSVDSLYQGINLSFMSAGNCDHCHGADPAAVASTTGEGLDVNLVDDWSSTMMANSAKDPFWRAKVSHEVFVNPQFQTEIEGTCTRCHAPLGRFSAIMNGEDDYHIADMLMDSVALDGVSCLACHRQSPQPEIALHTGQLYFASNLVAYGQYESPLISPMAQSTGYVPEYSAHISDSKLCAGCHSLVTETVDLEGNLTGDEFVEQATWHEWLNSSYPTQNTSCQTCHMKKLEGENILLAAGYDTPPRENFALHTLAGGNTLMLKLMRDNREALGIYASEEQFNETIAATNNELQNNSLNVTLTEIDRTSDTIYLDLKLTNKTGHKLPSGYPARRMSIHLSLTDVDGNEIFRSGAFDDEYAIPEENATVEPHYNVINSEEQVQIYEMVMGDVNNNRTTVLTRGYSHIKDNRLVPLGFTTASNVYDTTEIVLNTSDLDFNYDPTEGSGTDIIHFHIPTNGYNLQANATAQIYYQSLPPVWLGEILSINTPEVQTFNDMFADADKSPVLMETVNASINEFVGVIENKSAKSVRLIQEMNGRLRMIMDESVSMSLYDINGKILVEKQYSQGTHILDQEYSAGTYLLLFKSQSGKEQVEKVIIR